MVLFHSANGWFLSIFTVVSWFRSNVDKMIGQRKVPSGTTSFKTVCFAFFVLIKVYLPFLKSFSIEDS